MKQTYPSKLVTCLLMAVFFAASLGTASGYAWCVGEDGHVGVSYSNNSGCCIDDQKSRFVNSYDSPTVSHAKDASCGLCRDFTLQQYDAVFFKRVKRTSGTSVSPFASNVLPANGGQKTQLVAGLTFQPPPRISKTILAHRTIVLLN